MATEVKQFTGSAKEWDKLANRLARDFAPDIYPCQKCGYPVAKGYVCMMGCGTNDPDSSK